MEQINKEGLKKAIARNMRMLYRKELSEATMSQKYQALSYALKDYIIDMWMNTHKEYEREDAKTVYYLSMEFLMGRMLGNNILSMKAYPVVKETLEELNMNLEEIEEMEPDPALGNGGLGRLAACFLDSLSTLGYPAYGCGIRYKYGMFKQAIENGYQVEKPDDWLAEGYPFEVKRAEYATEVKFGGWVKCVPGPNGKDSFVQEDCLAVRAVPYDIPVIGYGNRIVNTLRIWDAEAVNVFNLDSFDKGDYQRAVEQENLARTICEVLYPNDNHYAGKELRLKQQYFFVSASVQRAVAKYMESHDDIRGLPEKVVFQLNDTHPTVTVPELMRILLDEYYLSWDEAWSIVNRCCAYTNHTIMSEALEKWPIDLFSKLLPRIYQIIEEINRRFIAKLNDAYPGDHGKVEKMSILYDGNVRMANLAIVAGFSVNGVAALHTEILKNEQLRDFYQLWPEKFNNKTNGITQRRFLLHGNRLLADYVTEKIGDGWITDLSKIEGMLQFKDNGEELSKLEDIKFRNKLRLAEYIKEHNGIDINPNSIYDVQVKRLHEYKRQLLNILHIMYLYNELKSGRGNDMYPRTFIFGAKASAGYRRAKAIIKLINSVGNVINNDPSINGKIKVIFIENYRVSNAELIFAAADVSEQISTASKEASGTSNMKFMLNGAITLGTMDGANVEIINEVGPENAVSFGLSSNEVIEYEHNGQYNPRAVYSFDDRIKRVVDQLVDGTYEEDRSVFRELYDSLLNKDEYFILKDFSAYVNAQKEIENRYKDRKAWTRSSLINIAKSGKFSSDRTIEEYVRDIWHLTKVTVPDEDGN